MNESKIYVKYRSCPTGYVWRRWARVLEEKGERERKK
jgi:hypothetical protein